MENKRGRPLEYCDEILVKAREYIDSCEDERYTLIKTDGDKSQTVENKIRVRLPTIEGLCLYLKIHRDTAYDWEKKFEGFSDILSELRNKQAERLINNGMSGDYNPTIAKVLLTKHGYREGQDLTTDGDKLNISFSKTFNKDE